jgi:hypothetical protein
MPVHSPIFAPAIVLVRGSLVMLGWLAVTRLPGMAKAGIPLTSIVGSRGDRGALRSGSQRQDQMSRFVAASALRSMNSRRGST